MNLTEAVIPSNSSCPQAIQQRFYRWRVRMKGLSFGRDNVPDPASESVTISPESYLPNVLVTKVVRSEWCATMCGACNLQVFLLVHGAKIATLPKRIAQTDLLMVARRDVQL